MLLVSVMHQWLSSSVISRSITKLQDPLVLSQYGLLAYSAATTAFVIWIVQSAQV